MKDYKVRQELYHRTAEITDYLDDIKYSERYAGDNELVLLIVEYFKIEMKPVFPAKSYSVAIIYGALLNKYFNENFYSALNDGSLFLGTDKYFKTYKDSKYIYDRAIYELNRDNLMDFESSCISQVEATVGYFKREFLLT